MTDKPMQSQNTKLPRVTIQEVAREAGVDRSTVSRVFNQPEFTSRTNCPEGQVRRAEAGLFSKLGGTSLTHRPE